ncbi:hypothetical protein VPHK453_0029 [Vibrio phage K453]
MLSSVEFTLTYSFLAASGSGPVLTAALEFGREPSSATLTRYLDRAT